jgi:hypothetical protein
LGLALLGLATVFHCVPFQRMIKVWRDDVSPLFPTAHTSLAEAADTPNSALIAPGDGLVTWLHWVPFHRKIKVLFPADPTAHTSLAETDATPLRTLSPVPTFGLVMALQAVPSQCCISVCAMLLLLR